MNHYKQHIAFRIAAILIVAILVLPIAAKFSHIFSHHEHEVCLGENQSHFHKIDFDCEFFKFKLNHQTTFSTNEFIPIQVYEQQEIIASRYLFLSSFQKLHFSLRGPPFNS